MKLLKDISLFSLLSDKEHDLLTQKSNTRSYPKNTVIVNEGDASDSLYLILSGQVKVFLSDANGKEIIINVLKEGDYFGELAIIEESNRSASIMTTEKATFAILSKTSFNEILSQHPEMAFRLLKYLARRVRELTNNIKGLALLDVYGRIVQVLHSLAVKHQGQLQVTTRLTHQEIANRVGASREMVSKILKELSLGGYIEYEGKNIIIHKLPSRF